MEAGKNQLTQIDFMSSGQAHCFLILGVESEGKINTLICFFEFQFVRVCINKLF